ncbi:MAG: hypothetical protein JWP88_1039 [Flaviaesturariibacter sp.]|nr:hypothetical protein [Flaviaesturariibacter sp.]
MDIAPICWNCKVERIVTVNRYIKASLACQPIYPTFAP